MTSFFLMCCAERTTRGNVSVVPFSIAATENACCAVFSYPSLLHSELTWIHRQQAAGFFFLLFLALFFNCQEHARLGPGPWQEIDCCMQPAVRVYRSIIDISSCACGLFFLILWACRHWAVLAKYPRLQLAAAPNSCLHRPLQVLATVIESVVFRTEGL